MTTSTASHATFGLHTNLISEYPVLDRSGRLPFSITFGLCRRSPSDTDPRSFVFDISGSALDVPYALSCGLLKLRNESSGDVVDVSGLPKVKGETDFITIPCPGNYPGSQRWKFGQFTTYSYRIDPNGPVGALLRLGEKYSIGLASPNLGLSLHGYSDWNELGDVDTELSKSFQEIPFVSSKAGSSSTTTFKVVESLTWPPDVETHMRFVTGGAAPASQSTASVLEFTFTNISSTPISVQARGHQNYLKPDDFFSPDPPSEDRDPRIIDALASPWTCLKIEDVQMIAIISKDVKRPVCGLYASGSDRRIKLSELITLMPGKSFVRRVDISEKVSTLSNGEYKMRLRPNGVWWCSGTVEQIADEGDARVPRRVYKTTVPPVELKCDETITFGVMDEKMVQ